jgi:hypothetical protein
MTARTPRAIDNNAFHQVKFDYPERSFAKALKEGRISERDATLIRAFIAETGLTQHQHQEVSQIDLHVDWLAPFYRSFRSE